MNKHRLKLAALFLFCFSLFGWTQSRRTNEVVSTTLDFVRNIEWPDNSNVYKVHIITTDNDLKTAFRSKADGLKINGREVQVSFTSYVVIPQGAHVLFVSNNYNSAISTILDRASGASVLLVTDSYYQERDVMINFFDENSGSLSFQFNRANILNQNLRLKSGFSSMGGEEIDLAKIYRQIRDSIRAVELNAGAVEARIDSLNMRMVVAGRAIADQLKEVARKNDELNQKNLEILLKDQKIRKQTNAIDSLELKFNQFERRLDSLSSILGEREEDLLELLGQVQKQQAEVQEGNKVLEAQRDRIAKQNEEIESREARLDEMTTVVDSQQSALIFLLLFLVVVVILAFIIFTAYRSKNRLTQRLSEQKEELAELLNELKETQTQLVQSEKMASLGVLTAGIAHEINNAINFVYSGIQVLSLRFEDVKQTIHDLNQLQEGDDQLKVAVKELKEKRKESGADEAEAVIDQMISSIKVGAERTTEIVKGLRNFSKSESDTKATIDVHSDIDIALLLLNSRHKDKDSIVISKDFTAGNPQLEGYKGQLSQAFLNIIGNALDAVDEKGGKGEIRIGTAVKSNQLSISISDNGVGMAEADTKKIFDPFYTTKGIGSGTGLGLSITYGIIERHGGTITVNSKQGEGTEFVIKLPLS